MITNTLIHFECNSGSRAIRATSRAYDEYRRRRRRRNDNDLNIANNSALHGRNPGRSDRRSATYRPVEAKGSRTGEIGSRVGRRGKGRSSRQPRRQNVGAPNPTAPIGKAAVRVPRRKRNAGGAKAGNAADSAFDATSQPVPRRLATGTPRRVRHAGGDE